MATLKDYMFQALRAKPRDFCSKKQIKKLPLIPVWLSYLEMSLTQQFRPCDLGIFLVSFVLEGIIVQLKAQGLAQAAVWNSSLLLDKRLPGVHLDCS